MRLPVFILYAIITCFCDKGLKLEKETFPFSQLILSFDYIAKREEELRVYAERISAARGEQGEQLQTVLSSPWEEWRTHQNMLEVRRERQRVLDDEAG